MTFERIYELAIEAAKARVDDLVERRLTQDNILLQRWHEQAKAELEDLTRGYTQMLGDRYKELFKDGNA